MEEGARGAETMAAEILAPHLEFDLYRIDLAGGETEKNLRRVFDAAQRSGRTRVDRARALDRVRSHTVARSSLHLGDYARAETSTSAPATPGFTFEEKDGTIIVGPLSSILALRRAPARDERKTSE